MFIATVLKTQRAVTSTAFFQHRVGEEKDRKRMKITTVFQLKALTLHATLGVHTQFSFIEQKTTKMLVNS